MKCRFVQGRMELDYICIALLLQTVGTFNKFGLIVVFSLVHIGLSGKKKRGRMKLLFFILKHCMLQCHNVYNS